MTRAAAHLIFSAVILISAGSIHAATLRISLEVDARDITHGIQHAHLTFPVHAGHLTLAYPKWIPGEHKPSGPITQLMNLHMMAGDRPLVWRRDSLDAFLFHVVVPPHVSALDVRFDYFSPPKSFGSGYGETPSATPHLLVLAFNQLILYPAESSAEAIEVKAQVLIPRGWKMCIRDSIHAFSVQRMRSKIADSAVFDHRLLRKCSRTAFGTQATRPACEHPFRLRNPLPQSSHQRPAPSGNKRPLPTPLRFSS